MNQSAVGGGFERPSIFESVVVGGEVERKVLFGGEAFLRGCFVGDRFSVRAVK